MVKQVEKRARCAADTEFSLRLNGNGFSGALPPTMFRIRYNVRAKLSLLYTLLMSRKLVSAPYLSRS